MPPNTKNKSLEGLRGIAALGVVVAHFLFSLLPSLAVYSGPGGSLEPRLPFEQWANLPFSTFLFNGGFQVSIFFALSGFVLTQRVVRTGEVSSLPASALRRYPRLIFPALLSVLFAWCLLKVGMMHTDLAVPLGGAGWVMQEYDKAVPLSAAVYQGLIGAPLFGETTLNHPLWTIRLELFGSLMLFLTYGLFGPKRPVLVGIMFCLFAAALTGPTAAFFHYATILVGSFFNYAVRRNVSLPRVAVVAIATVGLVLGAADFSPLYASYQDLLMELGFNWDAAKTLSQSVGACLVVFALIMAPSGLAARALESRVPAWLGRVSFSMYLVHWPIICSVGFIVTFVAERHLGWTFAQALVLSGACVLLAVLAISELFTRFVDAPSTRLAVAFSDRVIGNKRVSILSDVKRLAAACAGIGCVLILGIWTTTILAYTDPVVPPKFSQIRPMANGCGAKPVVRVAMYGDANVSALLGAAFCEDFGGKVAVSTHKGGTTADLSRNWQAEMASSDADVVVISTGNNDAAVTNIDFWTHQQQSAGLIHAAKERGKVVIVEAGSPVADATLNTALWSVTHNQKTVTASGGALLVDQYKLLPEAVPNWRQLSRDKLDRLRASNVYDAIGPVVVENLGP